MNPLTKRLIGQEALMYFSVLFRNMLLGFYHDSSIFISSMTSIHAGSHDDRHGEGQRVHMAGVPERIGTLKLWSCPGFKPLLPVWQASALSIALCPSGKGLKTSGIPIQLFSGVPEPAMRRLRRDQRRPSDADALPHGENSRSSRQIIFPIRSHKC